MLTVDDKARLPKKVQMYIASIEGKAEHYMDIVNKISTGASRVRIPRFIEGDIYVPDEYMYRFSMEDGPIDVKIVGETLRISCVGEMAIFPEAGNVVVIRNTGWLREER